MTQGLSAPAAVRLRRGGPPGLWVQVGGRGQGPRDVHRDPAFLLLVLTPLSQL